MNLQPLGDRVVVKPKAAEEKTASGIILPDTAREKPQIGEVIAVGPGKVSDSGQLVKMTVKKGDKVLYGQHAMSQEYTMDGDKLMIMSQNEVLSIIEE